MSLEPLGGGGSSIDRHVGPDPPDNPTEDLVWYDTTYNHPEIQLYKNGDWELVKKGANDLSNTGQYPTTNFPDFGPTTTVKQGKIINFDTKFDYPDSYVKTNVMQVGSLVVTNNRDHTYSSNNGDYYATTMTQWNHGNVVYQVTNEHEHKPIAKKPRIFTKKWVDERQSYH